ncbi:glycosyltransferase [Enterovibrio norvegicus]|uniref:glycosyltransferase n=1 Tax=Enterovibrio norvegicus TaxID=188144 RepID=UPI0024B197A5|nr:glycosyltransferase [Enterovibrio norvegicus]
MKILIATDFYKPAYKAGGPIKSIYNLVRHFDNKDSFDIVTSNRDIDNVDLDVACGKFIGHDCCRVSYFNSVSCIVKFLKLNSDFYDVIYLNSFFSFKFSILIQILIRLKIIRAGKVVLAPRGELSAGAMKLKALKKVLYTWFYTKSGLGRDVKFHFTSLGERDEARNYIDIGDSIVVPNTADLPPPFIKKFKTSGSLNLIFLSRISEKKNLLTLCEAISKVSGCDILFTIAGNIEDKLYWERCKKIIDGYGENVTVRILGALDSDDVKSELSKSHLFCLPTFNENYGHAIVEALSYSNLVLLSDQTPWSGVQNFGGRIVDCYDYDSIADYINHVSNLNESAYNSLSLESYNYVVDCLNRDNKLVGGLFND